MCPFETEIRPVEEEKNIRQVVFGKQLLTSLYLYAV